SVYETPPVNASFKISSLEPMEYKITPSSPGRLYDLSGAPEKITYFWSRLEPVKIAVKLRERSPVITEADVESVGDKLERVFLADEILLTYTNPHTALEYKWTIGADKIKAWLEVQRTLKNEVVFGLKKEKVMAFLEEKAAPVVVEEAADAKFKMDENGKIMEFQGSQQGVKLDNEKTYQAINEVVWGRTLYDSGAPKSVALQVEIVEPTIKTADVNNLGIGEVLGVGVSDYSNSPTNRIRNITNAVKKLNGILIKPGEEFSTLKHTGPFTYAGGYFPELVIKGDEVKPEIGGGLCQIGTTLFRMAMNSGMKITNRRNHSLVVFHYNDPVNGNPGTDATVYDPAPDFKFLNDTNNYVLIQTYMDKVKKDLIFTLWGAKDGRQASYSHPIVSKWYSSGEPKDIETDKLEPGKKECQNAFVGADASFVYTRVMPDGKEEKTTYTSHYRSLPKICLIGVEKPREGGAFVVPPVTEEIVGLVEG
ncbi:MAG: VanW family protein, partial [Patescibacteria group bacterium]